MEISNYFQLCIVYYFYDHRFFFLYCRLEIFPDGKHIIHFMYPQKFISIVDNFLTAI